MDDDLKKLLQDITDPTSRANAQKMFDAIVGTEKSARNVEIALLAVRRRFIDINEEAREFTQSFAASLQEITRTNIGLNEARKAQRALLSISQKIQNFQGGYNDLTVSELETLKKRAIQERERLKNSAEVLINQLKLDQSQKKSLSTAADFMQAYGELSEEQASILRQYDEGFPNIEDFINNISFAKKDQEELNRITGLTGAVLTNLNRIGVRALGGLGVNLGALEQDFKEAQKAVQSTANEIRLLDPKNAESAINKFKVFRAALPGVGKAAVTALVDPLVTSVFTADKLVDLFIKVNKASVDYQRLTGNTAISNASLNLRLATSVQYLEVAGELTKQLGLAADNVFDKDVLAGAAELINLTGLSAQEVGRLAILSQTTGRSIDGTVKSVVEQVNAFNRLNRSAVAHGVVIKDIAETSEDIIVSLGNQPEAISNAASAARKLGLSLKEVDSVASSLLDFQSSIQSELEAQLITGRSINLTKAREYALSNDLANLSKELFKNSSTILEFSRQGRIEQEAQAKALGLSRQQLAKIALQRAINLGLSTEELEKAAGVTVEDLKRTEALGNLKIAVEKIAQALVGPAELLASMLNSATGMGAVLGILAGATIAKMISSSIKLLGIFKTLARFARATSIAKAIGVAFTNPAYFAAGLGLAAAAGATITALTKADDFVDLPEGYDKRGIAKFDKGSISVTPINNKDMIVGGTKLNTYKEVPPMYTTDTSGMEKLLKELITTVKQGGDIVVDGNKLGKAVVMNTFKTS